MPVIIAHGQPKSGSTFLFATAYRLTEFLNRQEFYGFFEKRLGKDADVFANKVDRPMIERMIDAAGGYTLLVKTHDKLSDEVRELIDGRRVMAFTSFRDPRDSCRSMLDAGIEDRQQGRDRWFATRSKAEELIRPIISHIKAVDSWLDCPQVLALPYYIIANNQDFAVRTLCRHLGLGAYGSLLAGIMQAKKATIPEFHKGVSDRFLTDFPAEEIVMLNKAMAPQIAGYRKVAAERMSALGHRMLHDRLVAMRRAKLAEMGIPEDA